jgi:AraC-like DNA-binding protein
MLYNSWPNVRTNNYLIIILLIVGLQRFIYAIEVLGFINVTFNPLKLKPILAFYVIPVYYLFFIRLIYEKGVLKKELLHFIFPILLTLVNFFIVNFKINQLVYLVYSSLYFSFTFIIVRQYIYRKKKSILDKISYKAKKKWLLFMISLALVLLVFTNSFLLAHVSFQISLNSFYRYSSLVWMLILMYMFKNPVIIFGEQSLLKNIQFNQPQVFEIWNHKLLKQIENMDEAVYKTIRNKIDLIILEIKTIQRSVTLISTTTLTPETLAKQLKIPKRHLDFIFKYYCLYSVNDFSNLIKINYALLLIREGYLNKYTVDSLGTKCLFNSRFTFSKNFKKFVGVSVTDFTNTKVQIINNDLIQTQNG